MDTTKSFPKSEKHADGSRSVYGNYMFSALSACFEV